MKPRILLVNPPIVDFTAYDFWLKPYGMLTIAGTLRGQVDFTLFDYLDRLHPTLADYPKIQSDHWGRGHFPHERIIKPVPLANIPRHFYRYGRPRDEFQNTLKALPSMEMVWIQTTMTYWYPGIAEVIEDVREALGSHTYCFRWPLCDALQ